MQAKEMNCSFYFNFLWVRNENVSLFYKSILNKKQCIYTSSVPADPGNNGGNEWNMNRRNLTSSERDTEHCLSNNIYQGTACNTITSKQIKNTQHNAKCSHCMTTNSKRFFFYLKTEAVQILNWCKSHQCEVTCLHHDILAASAYSLRCQ